MDGGSKYVSHPPKAAKIGLRPLRMALLWPKHMGHQIQTQRSESLAKFGHGRLRGLICLEGEMTAKIHSPS